MLVAHKRHPLSHRDRDTPALHHDAVLCSWRMYMRGLHLHIDLQSYRDSLLISKMQTAIREACLHL